MQLVEVVNLKAILASYADSGEIEELLMQVLAINADHPTDFYVLAQQLKSGKKYTIAVELTEVS